MLSLLIHLSNLLYLCPFGRQRTPVIGVHEICIGKVKWTGVKFLAHSVGRMGFSSGRLAGPRLDGRVTDKLHCSTCCLHFTIYIYLSRYNACYTMTLRILVYTCFRYRYYRREWKVRLSTTESNREQARQKAKSKNKKNKQNAPRSGISGIYGFGSPYYFPWDTPFKLPNWVIWNLGVNKIW
jgi:hypothetical protein